MREGMFESAVRSTGDKAGVFEHNGEIGYFYLYDMKGKEGSKIVGAIRAVIGYADPEKTDFTVLWSENENFVGFFMQGVLCAAFDVRNGEQFGGNCLGDGPTAIPPSIMREFKKTSEK